MTTQNISLQATSEMRPEGIILPILRNALNISRFKFAAFRLAMVAVLMLLTTASAWAAWAQNTTIKTHITYAGLTAEDVTFTISSNGTSFVLKDGETKDNSTAYTVHFDPNRDKGGAGTMNDQSIAADETVNLSPCTFTNGLLGLQFAGWNTKADGSGTNYTDQQSILPTSTMTLYAQWSLTNDFYANGDTYTINTAAGWDVFCDALQDNDTYNRFSGKTVKLGNDIGTAQAPITRMAGSDGHDFCGTFDGDGHTLTVNLNSNDITDGSTQYVAPFRYVSNVNSVAATIKNLHVTGTIATSKQYTGGLIGGCWGNVSIENCAVSTAITSSIDGDGTHGGIVGIHSNGTLTITGCVFDGNLLGTTTHSVGGFLGWRKGTANIYNSLFAPAAVSVSDTSGATFGRNNVDTYNCYYTTLLCDGINYVPVLVDATVSPNMWRNGIMRRTVTAGNGVTIDAIAPVGDATATYSVSGITAYAKGITRGGTFYYGSGDEVSLTLSRNDDSAPAGYQFTDGYTASAGTLSGSTLTMPDADVIISAVVAIDWTTVSDGDTEATAYIIYNKDQLDLLAQRVNSGSGDDFAATGYNGKYFKLGADIEYTHTTAWNDDTSTEENFTPIGGDFGGSNFKNFRGNFDGANHVIRGIRIYKSGDGSERSFQALFGRSGAKVENIILADARITGYVSTSGIVGYNFGTVENCHVLSNVTIHAVQSRADTHGGIVGNNNSGTVTGCTSAAAITIADGLTNCKFFGGIAGYNNNATVENCLYLGTTLNGTAAVGAIVGRNEAGATVTNSYYTDPDITGKDNEGNARNHAASALGHGTATNCGPAMQDDTDNTGFLALMDARNAALTAVDRTTPLNTAVDITLQGRTLYKDGDWNTLCLPFGIGNPDAENGHWFDGTPLEGATVMTLGNSEACNTGFDASTGTLNLEFLPANRIEAGVAYIVKWDKPAGYIAYDGTNSDACSDLVNPTFRGVTIENEDPADKATVSHDGYVQFVGTYSSIVWETDKNTTLFLGDHNTLYFPQVKGDDKPHLGACRAYFQLNNDLTAGDAADAIRAFVLNFGDGETTGINSLTPDPSPRGEGSGYYTLDGRKIDGQPTKKGLYIHGNKKVVIK